MERVRTPKSLELKSEPFPGHDPRDCFLCTAPRTEDTDSAYLAGVADGLRGRAPNLCVGHTHILFSMCDRQDIELNISVHPTCRRVPNQ